MRKSVEVKCGDRSSERVGGAAQKEWAFNDFLSGIDINRTLTLCCFIAAAPSCIYNIKGKCVLNAAVIINVLLTTTKAIVTSE